MSEAVFCYGDRLGVEEVAVSGSFCHWKTRFPLERAGPKWQLQLPLPPGEHQYKFILNGGREWCYDPQKPHIVTPNGLINNVIFVSPLEASSSQVDPTVPLQIKAPEETSTGVSASNILRCQKEVFLKELTSTVISCTPSNEPRREGDTSEGPLYDLVLDDTIIFPEGGGQPDDYGTIDGVPVVRCLRRNDAAVHVVPQAFEVGQRVLVQLDWPRRFDNMQQHTAQHLITAIANKHYQWPTLSWSLGIDKSAIELKTSSISPEQLSQLEDLVNVEIMDQREVKVTIYDQNDPQLKEAKTRGLPDDMKGHVRVVSIGDLDKNMCCGTHVPNLSHLNMVKLLHTEKFKGNTRLYFVAGERARKFLGLCNDVQRKITSIIGRPLKEHVESIGDLQKTIASSAKVQKVLLADLAEQIGNSLKSQVVTNPNTKSIAYHYTHGNSDFMNTILSLLATPTSSTPSQSKAAPKGKGAKKSEASYPCVVMLTVGDETGKEGGNLKLVGPDPLVIQQLQPKLTELLDIKGKLVDGVLQGKINNLKNLKEAQKLVLQLNQ